MPSEGIGDTYAEESMEAGTMLTNIIDEGTWEDDPSEDNGGTYRGRGPSSTSGGHLTFTTSITKSITGFSFLESSPQVTTFYFKDTWTGFCLLPAIPFRSYIDPNRPGASPLTLFDISEGTTLVSAANGNFISLHDGYEFLKSSLLYF